jgi:hypothetical protein
MTRDTGESLAIRMTCLIALVFALCSRWSMIPGLVKGILNGGKD